MAGLGLMIDNEAASDFAGGEKCMVYSVGWLKVPTRKSISKVS